MSYAGPIKHARPDEQAIRDALRICAPELAELPVSFFGEGWNLWSFRAGGYILRSPRSDRGRQQLAFEVLVVPEIARYLSTPLPSFEVYCEDERLPFTAHRMLPGEPVIRSNRAPAPSFGKDLGRLIRELHAVPVERFLELGTPLHDGPTQRARRGRQYDEVRTRILPLLSEPARREVTHAYEAYLGEPENFAYTPCLVHQDLDWNVLIDQQSGEMTGLIDFGALVVGSPAMDLWLPVYGFTELGVAAQTRQCLEEAGIGAHDLDRMRPELTFIDFRWPLLDILQGLDTDDDVLVGQGIERLQGYVATRRS